MIRRPPDVSGNWTITSAAPPAQKESAVTVTKHGDFYSVDWKVAHGPAQHGVGLVQRAVFGVAWSSSKEYGVGIYHVQGRALRGRLVDSMSGGRASDELLKGPAGLNGKYQIAHATSGDTGKSYTGQMTIQPTGAVYRVRRRVGKTTTTGVGILERGLLVVGWSKGPDKAGVALYDVSDRKLEGQLAEPGANTLEKETWAKK